MYEVCHVNKKYKAMPAPALNNINFSSTNKDAIGILGSNGAGKTTLFMASNALLSIDSGDILVNGYSVKKNPDKVKQCTGLFTDKLVLYPVLTVKETITYFLGINGISKSRYEYWRDVFGLKEYEKKQVKHLSTGMLKKVMLLVSIISEPSVLFLDEPFSGLDPVAKKEFILLLKKLNEEQDMKLVISSHDLTETQAIVKEVVIMEKGSVIESGELNRLIEKYNERKKTTLFFNDSQKIKDYVQKNNMEFEYSNNLIKVNIDVEKISQFMACLDSGEKIVDMITNEVSLDTLYNEVRKNAIHSIIE